jgi:hypothetical protein
LRGFVVLRDRQHNMTTILSGCQCMMHEG